MILLGMMRFIEYEEIDLVNSNKSMKEALVEHLGSTHNNHVLGEVLTPRVLFPEICAHGSTKAINVLIYVILQKITLLVHQGHAMSLGHDQ